MAKMAKYTRAQLYYSYTEKIDVKLERFFPGRYKLVDTPIYIPKEGYYKLHPAEFSPEFCEDVEWE